MGELGDIGVADLLYLLALRRQTGKLSIGSGGDEVSLYLDKGQLTLVTSTNPNLRLGRMLISLNILDSDRLKEALQIQEQLGRAMPLGRLLLQYDYVSERQLSACVEEQCVQILSRVISAEEGIFVFHLDAAAPAGTEIVPLNADRIVMEATRRTDELIQLRAMLPNGETLIRLSSLIDQVADTLTDDEVNIAASIQSGAFTVGEIRMSTGLEEIVLLRSLFEMRERGIILTSAFALTTA